jgi:hypothetical protein
MAPHFPGLPILNFSEQGRWPLFLTGHVFALLVSFKG